MQELFEHLTKEQLITRLIQKEEETSHLITIIGAKDKIIKQSTKTSSLKNGQNSGWFIAGKFSELDKIINEYPPLGYIYGVQYNSFLIEQIRVTNWNKGKRIYTIEEVPHGDNASSFHPGRSIWTKQTVDQESKQGGFYHRYIDHNFKPCCGSNGILDLTVYVKKN